MYSSGSKGSNNRVSSKVSVSRIPTLLFSMFATFASIYVAGRLWQDSENRVYLIKELDRITGQGKSAISVDDTLKIIACREQQKKLSALEMELAAAKQEGFTSNFVADNDRMNSKKRHLVVIGILTRFGRTNNRNAIRKAWMGTGITLNKMENEKGIVARFVIGRSANHGDNLDKAIDNENKQTNDFIILNNHVEATDGLPNKAKLFFAHAADKWDAEFYAKVNDNVYVNIGQYRCWIINSGGLLGFDTSNCQVIKLAKLYEFSSYVDIRKAKWISRSNILRTSAFSTARFKFYKAFLTLKWMSPCCLFLYSFFLLFLKNLADALGTTLANHLDKPRVYIGCMKSGEVFSEPSHKWYEPDWWKFGDKKSYFRHASGEMYVISRALAKFISINRSILRAYAHDDISAGSWFIGLDVKHVDEGKFCCSSWSSGAICAGV